MLKLFGLEGISARVNARTAMGISTFFGCVRLISNLTSSNSFDVYKELSDGGSDKAKKHSLHYLLTTRPNLQMTPVVFKRTMVCNAIVHGFSIAQVTKDEKRSPTSLIPYPSHNVSIIEDTHTGFFFFRVTHNNATFYLSEDEVIFLKDLDFDGRYGGSIIDWQSKTIKLDLLTTGFAEKYYEKGTFIGGFLETPIPANDNESAKIYKKRVVESLKGEDGGFGLAILGPGIKWHSVARTPVESQLMEIFNKSDRDIAKMFNVPLSLIGDTEKQTSWGTGVEQMFIALTRSVIIPIAQQIEEEFNFKCFRRDEIDDGYYTQFNFRALLRGDSAAYGEYVTKMLQNGTYTHDEVRAFDNMAPIPGGFGKRHYINGAQIPVDKIDEFLSSKTKDNGTREKNSTSE